MFAELIIPPAESPVSIDEARWHCNVDHTEDDALLTMLVDAATGQLQRDLGYALVKQTWRQRFASFGCALIERRPFVGVTRLAYIDASGVPQDIAEASFRAEASPFGVRLFPASSWPSTIYRGDAVTVEFEVGTDADKVPADLKIALLQRVAFFYAHRESSSDVNFTTTGAYEALVWPYRRIMV